MKVIRIDGIIGDWLNTGEIFQERLAELQLTDDDELLIILNSPGGSVIDGFNIYNQIKSCLAKTTCKIEGFAASIASLVAMAAETVQMSEVGQLMIHRASVCLQGDKNEIEKQADILESIDSTQIQVFSSRTGLTKKEIEDMLDAETWFSAEEAKKTGFVDEIVDKIDSRYAAIYNQNKNAMKDLLAKLKGKKSLTAQEKPKAEETDEKEDKSKEQKNSEKKETSEVVTREEFDELLENFRLILEFLEKKDVEKPEVEKTEAEKTEADDKKILDAVEKRFQTMIKALPGSNGQPQAANKSFSNKDEAIDKYAKFRAEQNAIDEKTRLT